MNIKRFGILFFGFMLILVTPSYAFLSPGNMLLIFESVKGVFVNIFVFIIVNIMIVSVKVSKSYKKTFKKLMFVILFSFLILIIIVTINSVLIKYTRLSHLNINSEIEQEIDYFIADGWRQDFESQKTEYQPDLINSKFHEVIEKYSKKTDINKAINDNMTILASIQYELPNAIKFDFVRLVNLFGDRKAIESYTGFMNLSKNEKYVLVCYFGFFSRRASVILNYYGYNTTYARLKEFDANITELDYDFYSIAKKNSIVVTDFVPDNTKSNYIFITFEYQNQYVLLNEFLLNSVDNKIIAISYKDIKPFMTNYTIHESKLINLDENILIFDEPNTKIICQDKFHCALTVQFLQYHNVTKFKKIYHVDETGQVQTHNIEMIPIVVRKLHLYKWK